MPFTSTTARLLGRSHGWSHANYVNAYGTDARSIEAIIDDTQPLGLSLAQNSEYVSGFHEGMALYDNDQYDDGEAIV